MALYAVIKGDVVSGIAIRDDNPCTKPNWVLVDGMNPMPGPGWTYKDGVFSPPDIPPVPPPEKTEEEKIADATAAAIAKLIADGVLKQV